MSSLFEVGRRIANRVAATFRGAHHRPVLRPVAPGQLLYVIFARCARRYEGEARMLLTSAVRLSAFRLHGVTVEPTSQRGVVQIRIDFEGNGDDGPTVEAIVAHLSFEPQIRSVRWNRTDLGRRPADVDTGIDAQRVHEVPLGAPLMRQHRAGRQHLSRRALVIRLRAVSDRLIHPTPPAITLWRSRDRMPVLDSTGAGEPPSRQ